MKRFSAERAVFRNCKNIGLKDWDSWCLDMNGVSVGCRMIVNECSLVAI